LNSSGGEVGKYFYDGEGARVKKVVGNETTIFVYSNGKLIAEYSTATPTPNPTTNYTATDTLGSPRVLTDSNGQVKSRRDFMPFGEEIGVNTPQTAGRNSNPQYNSGDNVRQKFTGYQKDAESNLDFAEARYYNSNHGRFTAVDPLLASGKSSNPQTFNRFVYCLNRPLNYTDPTGLQVAQQGKWFKPITPDGKLAYTFANQAPDGYEPVPFDERGKLTGSVTDNPFMLAQFNPAGPMSAAARLYFTMQPVVDGFVNSSWNRDGFRLIQKYDVPAPGTVTDTSLDLLCFLQAGGAVIRPLATLGRAALSSTSTVNLAATSTSRNLPILNPHFTPDPTKVLQNITNGANSSLAANPGLASTVLSGPELSAAGRLPFLQPMQYGNAVERLAARQINLSPLHRQLFQPLGGPGRPDFIGRGVATGMNFDITTPAQIGRHLARPGYGSGLNVCTYQRPYQSIF
jgi:RHS repeat-associated protein